MSCHVQAQANKVKIVHTCGFDSIPSDIGRWLWCVACRGTLSADVLCCVGGGGPGTFMVVDWIKKNLKRKTQSVKMVFGDAKVRLLNTHTHTHAMEPRFHHLQGAVPCAVVLG